MILDIASFAQGIISDIALEVQKLRTQPKLAVIMVGDNPASAVYVRNKIKQCGIVGIQWDILHIETDISEDELIKKIQELNADISVDGILVQSPLPPHIDAQAVFNQIHPLKDVDGFSAANIARLYTGDETGLTPCTPKGIIRIIEWYFAQKQKAQSIKHKEGSSLAGKNVVVIGKSTIVGKPLAMMLLNAGATVTVCHSRTKDLQVHTLQADIIIPAVGKKHLLTADMIWEKTLVIDVGICVEETDDKRCLFGDCDTGPISGKADVTPVPRWVGPMTIAMLLSNTLLAHSLQWKQ